jgi:hypothetical protein
MNDRKGEVPMQKLAALLALLSLLSLMPTACATNGDVAAPRPGDNSVVSREDKGVSRPQTENTPPSDDQTYHEGDLRQPGLYLGPDGVYHDVPMAEDPRHKLY